MILLPSDPNQNINLMGIDPGSTNLGVAILRIDISTMNIVNCEAITINGAQLVNKQSWLKQTHGDRFHRISLIAGVLSEYMALHQPISIASESPFINGRFPAAGIALTEVLCMVKEVTLKYDPWKQLYLIPPSSGKNAIGAKGNANKDEMMNAMLSLPELANTCLNNIHMLDEHSIDALAIAYGLFTMYKNSTIPLN